MTAENNQETSKVKNANDKIEEAKAPFIPIGDYLREKRESKNVPLSEISEKTRIHLTLLRELENNNIKALPDKTYVRGFIKSYAKIIGTDITRALECLDNSYERLLPGHEEEKPQHLEASSSMIKQRLSKLTRLDKLDQFHKEQVASTSKFSLPHALLVLFLILILSYPLYHLFQIYKNTQLIQNEQKIPASLGASANQQPKNSERKTASPSDATQITPSVIETTTKTPIKDHQTGENLLEIPFSGNNQLLSIIPNFGEDRPLAEKNLTLAETVNGGQGEGQGRAEEEKKLVTINKAVEDKLQFQKINSPLFTVYANAPEIEDPNILPTEFKSSIRAGRENVFIKAMDGDSWITYKKDDAPVKTFIIKKDQHLFLHGKEIRILLGNINAMKIFYNNKLLDVESTSGVKNLVFPPANNSKYSLPLFIHHTDGKIYTSEEYKDLEKNATD